MGGFAFFGQVITGNIKQQPPVMVKFFEIIVGSAFFRVEDVFFKLLGVIVVDQKQDRILIKLKLAAGSPTAFAQLLLQFQQQEVSPV